MIFLTVGTQLPFDRLVEPVDEWAANNANVRIFCQVAELGRANYHPQNFQAVSWLDRTAYRERFEAARSIVAHAGTGTIIKALMAGKPILVMGRRAALGEQRNDHQLPTVEMFRARAGVYVAEDAADVPARLDYMMDDAGHAGDLSPFADMKFLSRLRSAVLSV